MTLTHLAVNLLQNSTLLLQSLKNYLHISLTDFQKSILHSFLVKLGFKSLSIRVELAQNKGFLFVPALEYWRAFALKSGNFEPWLLNYLKPKEGWVAVDIGAHIGYYTLLLSKNVKTSGKVLSIEPHPANFQLLKKNIEQNDCKNVVPVKAALSDKSYYGKLYSAKYSSEYSINYAGQKGHSFVKVLTLDSLLGTLNIRSINFIKIDVEGAELAVLKGAERTLTENKNLSIICEIHQPPVDISKCDVCKYLVTKGFAIKAISCLTNRWHIYAYK